MSKIKPNILAVDDELDMLETFKSILKKNYNVIPVSSGKEALQKVIDENIHLILLDIRMPGVDGMEVLKQVKEIDKELPVIMVTALKDIKLAVRSMKLGAYDYIGKPFEVNELLSLIEKALEKRALVRENIHLRQVVQESILYEDIIAKSESMRSVVDLIQKVSSGNSTILITGETGSGKELVARAIHKRSPRGKQPFVPVNCAAIPENLLESDLFGHEKGSFTGAVERHLGKFEIADKGTIFLDEIGCMAPAMQAKLLRVLESHTIERVGGTKPIPVNVRIISATNINLKEAIREGTFREDLYYRLNVIPISLPPLRQRQEDIPLLIKHFLDKYNKELGKSIEGFTEEAMEALLSYSWPGNARELVNLMERLVTLNAQSLISKEQLPPEIYLKDSSPTLPQGSLKEACNEFEKNYIKMVLEQTEGNQSKSARLLGIHRTTLISKMESLGLKT